MTKFFFQFKKPIFGSFLQFLGQTFFKNIRLSCTLYKGFQHPGKIKRNLLIKFQDNTQTDVRKEGWTKPILLDLSSYHTKGLTSTAAVDWLLKVKNKKCNVGLIKSYCITVCMQKISSIHTYSADSRPHELNDHTHF